eukprot:m.25645 g.25645  ORF g.25645 m.25645 type:complete len:906 (+) comp8745_c0_seq1:334-3051(+)
MCAWMCICVCVDVSRDLAPHSLSTHLNDWSRSSRKRSAKTTSLFSCKRLWFSIGLTCNLFLPPPFFHLSVQDMASAQETHLPDGVHGRDTETTGGYEMSSAPSPHDQAEGKIMAQAAPSHSTSTPLTETATSSSTSASMSATSSSLSTLSAPSAPSSSSDVAPSNVTGVSDGQAQSLSASAGSPGLSTSVETLQEVAPEHLVDQQEDITLCDGVQVFACDTCELLIDEREGQERITYQRVDGTCMDLMLEDVSALRVSMFSENNRPDVIGQLTVVQCANSFSKDDWMTWLRSVLLFVATVSFVQALIGPASAVCVVSACFFYRHDLAAFFRTQVSIEDPSSYFFLIAITGDICLIAWHRLIVSFMAIVAASLIAKFKPHWVRYLHIPSNFVYIRPTYPFIVTFEGQEELALFLRARKHMLSWKPTRSRIINVSVGSYWAEAVLSLLVYHDMYNSRRVRNYFFHFNKFILPVLSTFQILYAASPTLTKYSAIFASKMRADYGIRMSRFVVGGITNRLNRFPVFDVIYDGISNVVAPLSYGLNVLMSYTLPFEYAYHYIAAKLEGFRALLLFTYSMLAPLVALGQKLLQGPSVQLFKAGHFIIFKVLKPSLLVGHQLAYRPFRELREQFQRLQGLFARRNTGREGQEHNDMTDPKVVAQSRVRLFSQSRGDASSSSQAASGSASPLIAPKSGRTSTQSLGSVGSNANGKSGATRTADKVLVHSSSASPVGVSSDRTTDVDPCVVGSEDDGDDLLEVSLASSTISWMTAQSEPESQSESDYDEDQDGGEQTRQTNYLWHADGDAPDICDGSGDCGPGGDVDTKIDHGTASNPGISLSTATMQPDREGTARNAGRTRAAGDMTSLSKALRLQSDYLADASPRNQPQQGPEPGDQQQLRKRISKSQSMGQ